MSSPIEEIKSRLNIVDVIKDYIKLKKAGKNYRAVCPFHSEKTPSFFVSPSRQMWHCFGCGEGSSMFDFVMKIEGVEFRDALKILAKKAGVELRPVKPELKTKREGLYQICELTAKFFQKQLGRGGQGKKAKKYLLDRSISEDSIKNKRLGWAPDSWQGLSDFLTSQGYKKEEIRRAGLALRSDKGKHYDRFRGRIMFPIFNSQSQVVGFGGRVLKKGAKTAKYLNTPNTLIYDKSKILYGLEEAKVGIRKKDFVVLAEGYVDVILGHQNGLTNFVSTSGTALTPTQLNILKRYTDNLYLAFDMDFAGEKATKRAIDLAQTQKFDLKIIRLDKGHDPADVMTEDPKKFKAMVEGALSIFEFYFNDAFSRFDKDEPAGRKKISEYLLPIIKRIENKIERFSWVQKIADELGVKEEVVEEEMKKVRVESGIEDKEDKTKKEKPKKTRRELLEERLLVLLLKKPKKVSLVKEGHRKKLSLQTNKIIDNLEGKIELSDELKKLYSYLSLKADIEEGRDDHLVSELKFCLNEINNICLKDDLQKVTAELKKAEAKGDKKKVKKLLQQCRQLTKNKNDS